ncbi:MAG: M1 family metallopeptidase [Lactobacillus sp.]|nr:M1 family metallopeptidase [Lactobacillus sp.]
MGKIKRFYETFHPDHYDLRIHVDRSKKLISGTSTIFGEAVEKTILIHEKNMKIKDVRVDGESVAFDIDEKIEGIKAEVAAFGKIKVEVDYEAPLTDTMMGIYPSYYEIDGVKKEIIGTQFETTFARQAFPSVDEPEAKATFSLALSYDEKPGETTLANMPEKEVKDGVHYFEETVRMSTYLVAFAFGELQAKYTTTKSGVKVGVFATKAHEAKELDFAVDIAKRGIEFYEDFYQTPYPLPHSWQLALPDFSAGAMENWGLITYREAYLLLDPDNTPLRTKKIVASVITHELAHQWFGDLVTMKWWDNLWLNESFANMMEYLSLDHMQPNWKMWELFQTSEAPAALLRDATDGVQSVYVELNDPAEIDTLFDGAIVYAKGSRLLVMVRALIGDEALQKGLKLYFDTHKYGNTVGDDLWDALSSATDLEIGKIMHSWLNQPGYPVVHAYVEDGHLKLSQKQFFIGEGKDVGRTWQIPLHANFDAPKIMSEKELDLGDYAEIRQKAGHALRINVGNTTHMIVNYDQTLMADIQKEVTELDSISKMQLLQDLRLLAESKQVSYASIVPLLAEFKEDESSLVNDALYTTAAKLNQFVLPESSEEKDLKAFYQKLSSKQVERLGFLPKSSDSDDDQTVRAHALSAAVYGENQAVIDEAKSIFEKHEADLSKINADVRSIVLANQMKNFGSLELLEKLTKLYQKTSNSKLKSDLASAITSSKDPAVLKEVVSYLKNSEIVKPQDLRSWFAGLLFNSKSTDMAWNWIKDEWGWLDKTVGGDMEFTTFITVIARCFKTKEQLADFKAFFEPKLDQPMLTREIKMDISVIASRVDLIEEQKASVNKAVKENL